VGLPVRFAAPDLQRQGRGRVMPRRPSLATRTCNALLVEVTHPDSARIVGITGHLPILVPLLTIDVLWSDLHMVHEGRSLMNYDSFYYTFRGA